VNLRDLLVLYALVGIACAVAVLRKEQAQQAQGRFAAVWSALATIPLWPLWAPFVLATPRPRERPAPPDAKPASAANHRASAGDVTDAARGRSQAPLARIDRALEESVKAVAGTPMSQVFSRQVAQRIAAEVALVAERIDELAALASSDGLDREASAARLRALEAKAAQGAEGGKADAASERAIATARLQYESLMRLEALRATDAQALDELADLLEALRAQLAAVPGVKGMAATFTLPLWSNSLSSDYVKPGQGDRQPVNLTIQPVDFGYFGLNRVPLLAGRDFSRDFVEDEAASDDKSRLSSAVINETAMRALGFADASAAIGQEVQSTDPGSPRHHRIIGVAPDFPLDSIRAPVPPSIFVVDPDLFKVLSVKLSGANLAETLRGVDAAWREAAPQRTISRMFLDDRIAGLYRDVTRQGQLFESFAAFAVALGCLGLIGLSAYTAERRTKEIGIRKALGASAIDIYWLLIKQFAKPVLLANALAWPFAWWFMRDWLDGFAYRIDLGPAPFLAAGLGAVAIAVAATTFHAVQSARSRPATALRYE